MRVEHNFPLCPSIRPRSPTCDDLPWHSPGMLWLNCWTYFRSAFVFRHIYFLSCLLSQPSPWAQRGSSTSQSEASATPQDYRMVFLKCQTSAVRLPNLPYRIRSRQGGPWGLSRLELNCLLRTLIVLKANRSGARRWASLASSLTGHLLRPSRLAGTSSSLSCQISPNHGLRTHTWLEAFSEPESIEGKMGKKIRSEYKASTWRLTAQAEEIGVITIWFTGY